jgi:serine protease Do
MEKAMATKKMSVNRRSGMPLSTAMGVILAGSLAAPVAMTIAMGVILAGSLAGPVATSAFDANQSSAAHRIGWLLPPAESQGPVAIPVRRNIGLANLVEAVKPAVISVTARHVEVDRLISPRPAVGNDEFSEGRARTNPMAGNRADEGRARAGKIIVSRGAGFFISADGYVVTNNHVIESSQSTEILADDGTAYKARLIASDPASDLALLKIDGRDDFPFVDFSNKPPRVGDEVFAVGNPFGFGGTVTAGIVSALERHIGTDSYGDLIQIDAPINKGNSGGPSFDMDGKVVGVNTVFYSPSDGSVGIGFAIPSEIVKRVILDLKANHAVNRGWFGARLQAVTPSIAEALALKAARGAIVAETSPGSPAARAGISAGDVITSINGDLIKDNFALSRRFAALAPGRAVDLAIVRNSDEMTVTVVLGQTPPAPGSVMSPAATLRTPHDAVDLGLALAPVPGTEKSGVVVLDVDPNGRAASLGIYPGDIIMDVSGRPVRTPGEVHEVLNQSWVAGRPATLLRLRSGDMMHFIGVPFDPA